jgi:hypothetical protein
MKLRITWKSVIDFIFVALLAVIIGGMLGIGWNLGW